MNALTRSEVQAPIVPFPAQARPEIFIPDILTAEEKYWVPQSEGVSFLPLCLGITQGYYVNLLRVRRSGVLSCHRHTGSVHAQVLKGAWYYREHDWIAKEGCFVMETPGETHTLVVPPDVPEMITWFHVTGSYVYLDEGGQVTSFEDVFTKIDRIREHDHKMGWGDSRIEQLSR